MGARHGDMAANHTDLQSGCICSPGVVELVRSNLAPDFPLFHGTPPVDIFEVAEVGEAAGHIRRHGGQPPVGDLVKLVPVPLRDQVPPRQQISTSGSVRICVDIYP